VKAAQQKKTAETSINLKDLVNKNADFPYAGAKAFEMIEMTSKIIESKRVLAMEESATLKMAQLARDIRGKGHDVISLSLGEPDFDTPVHIKEAAIEAMKDGFTKYTPVAGLVELRESISKKFKRDNNLDYGIDQIVVSNGAKQSIANVSLAMLNEGDEVIILAPFWVSYSAIVKLGGGVPVILKSDISTDYKVAPATIEAAITDRTKLILFSSPCNPTGSVYTSEELEAIANIAAKHSLYIISDEIYEYINFTGKHVSIGAFPQASDRTITINGFSKGFAMTGWRLGYMGAPKWIAKACTKIQGQFTSGATAFGQKAGAFALQADMTPTHEMCKTYLKRRDIVIKLLREIPGMEVNEPQGAFYVFPDVSNYFGKSVGDWAINNADDFCEYLLNTVYVALVTGRAFGADNCIRISYASSEAQLIEAMTRMKTALGKLS